MNVVFSETGIGTGDVQVGGLPIGSIQSGTNGVTVNGTGIVFEPAPAYFNTITLSALTDTSQVILRDVDPDNNTTGDVLIPAQTGNATITIGAATGSSEGNLVSVWFQDPAGIAQQYQRIQLGPQGMNHTISIASGTDDRGVVRLASAATLAANQGITWAGVQSAATGTTDSDDFGTNSVPTLEVRGFSEELPEAMNNPNLSTQAVAALRGDIDYLTQRSASLTVPNQAAITDVITRDAGGVWLVNPGTRTRWHEPEDMGQQVLYGVEAGVVTIDGISRPASAIDRRHIRTQFVTAANNVRQVVSGDPSVFVLVNAGTDTGVTTAELNAVHNSLAAGIDNATLAAGAIPTTTPRRPDGG